MAELAKGRMRAKIPKLELELGDLYMDKLNKHSLTRNLVHRLERLGYTVTLEQKAT